MRLLVSNLNRKLNKVKKEVVIKKIEKQRAKGKLTARERLDRIFDQGCDRLEIAALSRETACTKNTEAVLLEVVVEIGRVHGRLLHSCSGNDATVKAGAWFPITAKKNLGEIALDNKLPIIYLVDSAGVFLPMRMKSSQIKSTLDECSEITHVYLAREFLRLLQLWDLA